MPQFLTPIGPRAPRIAGSAGSVVTPLVYCDDVTNRKRLVIPLKPPSTSVSRLPERSRFCSDVCGAPLNVPWSMDDRRLALKSRLTRCDHRLNDAVAIVTIRLRLKLAVDTPRTPLCGSELLSSTSRRLPLTSRVAAFGGSLEGSEVNLTLEHVTAMSRRPPESVEDCDDAAQEQAEGHVMSAPADKLISAMMMMEQITASV